MQVWLECAGCKQAHQQYEEMLGWEDEETVECACGGVLKLVGYGKKRLYVMPLKTVEGARAFFQTVLAKEAIEGGVQ